MPATKPIPLEGVLNCWYDEHDLADLLLTVCRSQKTGRLRFSNPEGDKTLYIKDGRVIFAESSSDDDGLGQHLLRIGKISLDQHSRVSKMVEPGKRLGALLVSEGALEPKELVPAVVGQVRAIILGLFRRTESWYQFREEELSKKESITLDMPVAELILGGIEYVESWRRVSKGLGDFASVHRVVDAGEKEWLRLELDPAVSELLSILREPVTITKACAESRLPDFEACRFLWAFRSLGWIVEAGAVVEKPAEAVVDEEPALAEPGAPVGHLDVDEAALAMAAGEAAEIRNALEAPPAKPAIPERLIRTRVSMKPPQPAKKAAAKAAPPPPAPIPDELIRTQLVVEPPAAPPPATPAKAPQATTVPDVRSKPTPKPLPDDVVHTQLDVATPPKGKSEGTGATLSTPSAAEMMESILNDGTAAPASPKASKAPRAETPRSNAATQFFSGPSAFELPEPPEAEDAQDDGDDDDVGEFSLPDESYDDFLAGNMGAGFDAMALEHAPPGAAPEEPAAKVDAPEPLPGEDQVTMASFQDLSLSNPNVEAPASPAPGPGPVPAPEPSFADAAVDSPDGEAALPVLEGVIVNAEPDAEPPPSQPSGMEFFIADDPLAAPSAPEPEPEPSPFSSEDLLTRREEPVAAALPKRPRTDDMDLDMDGLGHVLGRDR